MFDFIDNNIIKILVEIFMDIFMIILGFFSGIKYSKRNNRIGNIKRSDNNIINQENN
ncbi:MAG: hypothetical protein IKG58_03280 [Bacilli bacterium]|nr:hypothetical protein [Bacilli bacterium]MBR3049560.1 hypothetical protein [Bacilli bacterium]